MGVHQREQRLRFYGGIAIQEKRVVTAWMKAVHILVPRVGFVGLREVKDANWAVCRLSELLGAFSRQAFVAVNKHVDRNARVGPVSFEKKRDCASQGFDVFP